MQHRVLFTRRGVRSRELVISVCLFGLLMAPQRWAKSQLSGGVGVNRRAGVGFESSCSALTRYLDRLRVLEPENHKGLSIFPLVSRDTFPLDDYLALDEAMRRGHLIVTELAVGRVDTVQVENVSDRYVFGMGGEIMQGAKQDRTLRNDLLVPPYSGKFAVSVFCTEHGRWTGKASSFESAQAAVPNSVRGAAKVTKEQRTVWDAIAENQSKLRIAAPTKAAREVYSDKGVQQRSEPYIEKLGMIPTLDRHMVGVAAALGDRILAVDIFGDTSLFRKLYPKLLRSYMADILGDSWRGRISVEDIQRMIAQAADAPWERGDTDGLGNALEFHYHNLHGSALVYKEMVIHCDIFPTGVRILNRPGGSDDEDSTPPPNLRYRREQRTR